MWVTCGCGNCRAGSRRPGCVDFSWTWRSRAGLPGGDSAWQNAPPWRTATGALAGSVAVESRIDEELSDQRRRDHGRLARHRHLETVARHSWYGHDVFAVD